MRPARARVLEAIRTARHPVGVDEVAAAVGLGLNAVRHHLAALEADGLAVSDVDRDGNRGRPRRIYTPGPGTGGPYERLALALLHAHRTGASLESAGRAVAPPGGHDLVAFLANEGFDPRPADDGVVLLAACPLVHSVNVNASVVCRVHQALVAAIGDGQGQPARLVPGRPGTCRVIRAGTPRSGSLPAETAAAEPSPRGRPPPEHSQTRNPDRPRRTT